MVLTEREMMIWLSHIGGVDVQMVENLLRYFGNLTEVWEAEESHLLKALQKHRIIASRMIKNRNEGFIEKIKLGLIENNILALTLLDEDYPAKLKGIYDPPIVIYIKGKGEFNGPLIAMVGARKASSYGKWAAYQFAKELSEVGVGIVSGLALGIDTASHQGVVDHNGYTIAVLACGLDQCYPTSNSRLGEQILKNGCLISEYSPGTLPLKHHFPARNRLISGLSDGVVIIEAAEKSGALITVDFALQQGKEVYSLPGNVNQLQSKGTNGLIRDGAKILLDIDDIIEDLEKSYPGLRCQSVSTNDQLSESEAQIYALIKEGPIHIDMLSYRSRLKIQELFGILTALELKGFISQLPGKSFTAK